MAQWVQIAALPKPAVAQPPQHELLWPAIESISTPMLLLTGTCDLFLPPTRLRELASHLPSAHVAVFAEAGHAPHWESYLAFNETVLGFLREHAEQRCCLCAPQVSDRRPTGAPGSSVR
jgi:pimeloyl-ACP methyl ester carboxylesterase